jgi:radical SAM superfamily enzyme YgiQ (UPF0313 family)
MQGRFKIVLYNPQAVFFTMPLALVAVGSHLDPERYEVVIVDGRLEQDPESAVVQHLEDAVCVGVTVLTGAPIRDAVRISRVVKRHRPNLPVVWGGWHPSMFGRECLEEASVDITVQGQGEATFAEIVDRLAAGEPLDDCAGCTYRDSDAVVRVNSARPVQDINTFRRHDYGLIDVQRYYDLKGKRQLDYISSQGCRFRCTFCADPFVYQRSWVSFTPERIGVEIEALWRRYGFDDVNLQDETFFTYARHVEAIAEEFLRRQLSISWAATMRADQCYRLPEEVFIKCKESGLRRVLIGVETGSQAMMDRIQKDIKLEHVFFAAERCRRHDVSVHFPFIVGFPGEDDESVKATLNVAKRLRAMSPDFQTPIFYFKPYPGSALTEEVVRNGHTLPCNLDEWTTFDFIGSAGPWVSPERHQLVERFKFYQHVAWDRVSAWKRPLQKIARWRCNNDFYGFPVEKAVGQWLNPPEPLSCGKSPSTGPMIRCTDPHRCRTSWSCPCSACGRGSKRTVKPS